VDDWHGCLSGRVDGNRLAGHPGMVVADITRV
jgi:hypothetical protein